MKLLIEEYQYELDDVVDVLEGLFTLQDVERKVSVSYVGYYYNPNEKVRDVVFILPKVLIDEKGYVFGKYDPKKLINLEEAEISEHERKFLYEFAVWIHRAIVVYNASHEKNDIVLHRQIESEGRGSLKKKSNTLLDIILSLMRFNKENQQFFTFILKNLHSGFNKINWDRTVSRTSAVIQDDNALYLNPVNKVRQVNFDEELIIIYFSILQYISETYGFKANINFGFKLITGEKFKRYLNGYGRTRLRQIKYKYFSDKALKLWDLCYAFFDKTYKIHVNVSKAEYLLVKSFYIVFEAMIDELIGTPRDQLPAGLADQYDGKIVDHFYTYEGLLIDNKANDDIYYIGDSKYYKLGNHLGTESIFKQRTYARNVIQWNLDIWLNGKANPKNKFESIKLFDEVTEGYDVIPNFFISATINQDTLSFEDKTTKHDPQPPVSRQFNNRLYDRDTLLLSHYDVNFLFVLALYARNNQSSKAAWREKIRIEFRKAIQEMLKERFDFYALAAHPDVNASEYFKAHFQDTLGKTFRPFDNKEIYSLALDRQYKKENEEILSTLRKNFFVIDCPLGINPEQTLVSEIENFKGSSPDGYGLAFVAYIPTNEFDKYRNRNVKNLRSRSIPKGNIQQIRYVVPMINGAINGYYDVMSIGITLNDNNEPRINFSFGDFHSLGEYDAIVQKGNMILLYYGGAPVPLTKIISIYENAPKFIPLDK